MKNLEKKSARSARWLSAAMLAAASFAVLESGSDVVDGGVFASDQTAADQDTAGQTEHDKLAAQFDSLVQPFVTTYCIECHGSTVQEAKLDLSTFHSAADVLSRHQIWQEVAGRLLAGEMPPKDHDRRPDADQSRQIAGWVNALLRDEARRQAGDPGIVPARRLSNAEYNYTIRDLTGADLRPTREFPVDPANESGFDNSAESLTMSPALLNKYLGAAREVAECLVLKPTGFDFAPHPVMTDTDRDKYCVNRIVDFYRRQPTRYADYFLAAWYRRCLQPADIDSSFAKWAETFEVSPKYLRSVWELLTDGQQGGGPIDEVRQMWLSLPNDPSDVEAARKGCEKIEQFIVALRRELEPKVEGLSVDGIHKGAQAFVLWKNDQYAANRRRYDPSALIEPDDASAEDREDPVTAALILPQDQSVRQQYLAGVERFASMFPDAFYISERGRDYVGVPRERQEKGRLLSAGFHSMMGYYRDDAPLCDLILSDAERLELDTLWQELDFVCSAPERQYKGFVWFERTDSSWMRDPEFDFARSEDKSVVTEPMIRRLSEVYLAKAVRHGAQDVPLGAIEDFFRTMNRRIRWVEQAHRDAEPGHLQALQQFAARCFRRSLSEAERQEVLDFYQHLRRQDGLTHEEAMQDSVVSLLMSPHFLYRMDLAGTSADSASKEQAVTQSPDSAAAAPAREALTDFELASRLSYFLWASMPDQQLLEQAAAGRLSDPGVLRAEVQRMLQDEKVAGMVTEFAGNWLDFRRFEEHNSVDRQRFPQFSEALRSAMFEEPIRFLTHLFQDDLSVLDCLYADYTYVNGTLAEHYGLDPQQNISDWTRLDQVRAAGRGGLIPMAVFLTQNSPGLRTSPVKRGYWVVRRLLGEQIPPPPPNVPELPADESAPGELTLREILSRHRDHSACAGCHDRFDSIGLVFENFGPIGERRDRDLGGRPVETMARFPDGVEGSSLEDLLEYLRRQRQDDFVSNLCRKLLSFALGRSLQLSDELLVDEMRQKLQDDGYRPSVLIETIVASPQFLSRRRPEFAAVP